MDGSAVLLVVVGATFVCLGCLFIVTWFRKKQSPSEIDVETAFHAIPSTPTSRLPIKHNTPREDVAFDILSDLNLPRLDERAVTLCHKVHAGGTTDLWRGLYQGQAVAVRRFRRTKRSTMRQVEAFWGEIKLVSAFESPYVVAFVGLVPSSASLRGWSAVLEWMDGGDLRSFLATTTCESFPWADKYMHVHSLASALAYLHAMFVLHRDVQARHVLLDAVKGTKLTGFDRSREESGDELTMGVGTFRWMAPEVIVDDHYTNAADVYSFGVLLSEMDTHQTPYDELKHPLHGHPLADSAIMIQVVQGKIVPTFSGTCPPWLYELAMDCLAHNPSDRPTAEQVARVVRIKLRDLSHELFSL
ncbi:Aste57867_12180 [Aphanomyces stellatus]|uniref:Aste57867_12180 protein n=1 Tax=Aphanomyces stellatus TaxID=120398 RepID=A0A485KUX5_9STRA|nr:hypothetical protein As57867_012135 [Aphanomyces stellatus]VFT89034.1 Aste57867_12180 [Aphanomyces stellatus]